MTVTIEDLAHRLVPEWSIGDVAAGDHSLRRYNVVGAFAEVSEARTAVPRLEDIAGDGAHVQFVGFDVSTRDDDRQRSVDPEGVTGLAGRRVVLGGLLGALAGLVTGGITLLASGDGAIAVAVAIGGVILLGLLGAIVASFAAFGASDAWRQTFQPEEPLASIVAVLTDDEAVVEPATRALREYGAHRVEVCDREGNRS